MAAAHRSSSHQPRHGSAQASPILSRDPCARRGSLEGTGYCCRRLEYDAALAIVTEQGGRRSETMEGQILLERVMQFSMLPQRHQICAQMRCAALSARATWHPSQPPAGCCFRSAAD